MNGLAGRGEGQVAGIICGKAGGKESFTQTTTMNSLVRPGVMDHP
jgi:hypothetical protein